MCAFTTLLIFIIASHTILAFSPIRKEVVDRVKANTDKWQPCEVEENPFKDYTEDQIKHLFGLPLDAVPVRLEADNSPQAKAKKAAPIKNYPYRINIPQQFDWRTEDLKCTHPINRQGPCGSCWAFGPVNILSDRFCIASKGKVNVTLAPQVLVSCA